MTPLEGWLTKAKEALCPHEVRADLLDTNPVFECLMDDPCGWTPTRYFSVSCQAPPPPLNGQFVQAPQAIPLYILVFHDILPPPPKVTFFSET